METGNQPEKDFKVMIMNMIEELRRRMHKQRTMLQVFNKELKNIKINQTEWKNIITEIKNTIEGINIRLNDTEESIRELEDRVVEITEAGGKKKEEKEMRTFLRDL